jgi:hypothetical protein
MDHHSDWTEFVSLLTAENTRRLHYAKVVWQFGFDEADYLKAIQTAPVFNKAQMETMVGVVRILLLNGLARLQEERL